jgi:hypothetical protein
MPSRYDAERGAARSPNVTSPVAKLEAEIAELNEDRRASFLRPEARAST